MRLLINDLIQQQITSAPTKYSSPQLFETYLFDVPIVLQFTEPFTIDCIGLGNCNSSGFTITTADGYSYAYTFDTADIVTRNGLYLIPEVTLPLNPTTGYYEATLTFDYGSKIGRIGIGKSTQLNTTDAKEIGFTTDRKIIYSSTGAILPQIQGYAQIRLNLTTAYEITADIYKEFKTAYRTQLSMGFPLFIVFDKSEQDKFIDITFPRFYASMQNTFMLQSSLHNFLYSLQFQLTEAF